MKKLLVGGLFAITTSVAAHAADMPTKAPITPPPAIQGWTYSLTPYFWATSLNGSTTVKGRTADVDVGFFDILDHTQFPKGLFQLAALGEARNGRFGLLTDILYMKADLGASATRHAVRMRSAAPWACRRDWILRWSLPRWRQPMSSRAGTE